MKELIIEQPKGDRIVDQLASAYYALKQLDKDEKAKFDLSKLKFVSPLLVSMLAIYINDTESDCILPKDEAVNSYLNTIAFPKGLTSISNIQHLKNYLPLSLIQKTSDIIKKEEIISCFVNLIDKLIGKIPNTQNAVFQPIFELVSNIFEHSKRDFGMILGQTFPKKGCLEICIIDRGRGLAASYKQEMNLIYTDEEALKQSMLGKSTKRDKERGFGVRTSKNIVCEALGGEFMMLSGNATLISTQNSDRTVILPNFYWQGVIISYRIPFPKQAINIYPYLE